VGTAHASSARVAITGGGLTMSSPSVTVVSQNPAELDLRTAVTDARGTGGGWFLSLAAASQSIDLHVVVPGTVPSKLNFDLSISTPPSAGVATGSTSLPCSIPDLVNTGTCPRLP
jgi:hypothetical protein